MKELKEFLYCVVLLSGGFLVGSFYNIDLDEIDKKMIEATGSDYYGFNRLKQDCEKNLPLDQECVMIYDFVAVKNGEGK